MTTAHVASSSAELERHVEGWDRLAVSASRPLMRPSWLISWWNSYREQNPQAELRVGLALDGDELVGVLPMFTRPDVCGLHSYSPLGTGSFWGIRPLASATARDAVGSLADALAASRPAAAAVELPAIDAEGGWLDQARQRWGPSGASIYRQVEDSAHLVEFDGDCENWLRSSGRRGEYLRQRRRLQEHGVILRASVTAAEFEQDLTELMRLTTSVGRTIRSG